MSKLVINDPGSKKLKFKTVLIMVITPYAAVGLIILAAVWAVMIVISTFLGVGTFGGDVGEFILPQIEDSVTSVTGGGSGTQPPTYPTISCTDKGGTCYTQDELITAGGCPTGSSQSTYSCPSGSFCCF